MPPSRPVAGNTEQTVPANRVYYPALDGLRAVAFLLVFLEHYALLPWGWAGVNIFFVLSGFLITGILWDTRDRLDRTRNFYIRRILRIFPLYYGVFLALFLTTPLFHWKWSIEWIAWPLYIGNFLRFINHGALSTAQLAVADGLLHSPFHNIVLHLGHFWSLCVEEQFYLFWPTAVFWARSKRKLTLLCFLLVVVASFARITIQHYAPASILGEGVPFRILTFQPDSLLLGAGLALLWRGEHRHLLQRIASMIALFSTFAIVVYFIWQAHFIGHNFRHGYIYPVWTQTWGLSFIELVAGSFIICALRPGSLTYRILKVKPLRYLGRISYGAYVYHEIPHAVILKAVLHLGRRSAFVLNHHGSITLVIALLFTLCIAALSFHYFEASFLNLKKRWAPASTLKPTSVTPAEA